MLKKVLIAVAAVLVLLVVLISVQPNTFTVTRKLSAAAAPAQVYEVISDFHQWQKWSPWDEMDPDMKREYTGAERGKEASYYWKGNDKVGEGRMTITDVKEGSSVTIKLEFLQPFPSNAEVVFAAEPEGTGSSLSWTMVGQNGFASKAMQLFMSMDKMIGPDFEKGLAKLKTVSEGLAAAAMAEAEAKAKAAAENAAAATDRGTPVK